MAKAMRWKKDTQFRLSQVAKVEDVRDGWRTILDTDGWWFAVPPSPVEIAEGMPVLFFGRGLGFTVRGLVIGGQEVFYRTEEEQQKKDRQVAEAAERKLREEFERNRADMDRRYNALPEVFRRRIDKFRANNPDFRWKNETYELFCCEQAIAFADALKTPEAVEVWARLNDTKEQRRQVPALSHDHSGNTFRFAVRLAHLYLTDERMKLRQVASKRRHHPAELR